MLKIKENTVSGTTLNVMGKLTTCKGDIYAEENFRIDGKLEGNIQCKGKVVVGPHAQIKGNIQCLNADLMGEITGNVYVKEVLSIRSSVMLTGDVIAGSVEIESGAVFNGSCKMQ